MGTDGHGVTTLVAFFNCRLHCRYCINNFCHEQQDRFKETPRAVYTPEQLIEVLQKDDIYYKMSGGGITFGGGEPLLQASFIHQVCKLADPAWNMRVETSLNVPWRCVQPVLEDLDEWIIDIKTSDRKIYQDYTGVEMDELINNLFRLQKILDPSKIRIRIPRIPDYTSNADIQKSIAWIKQFWDIEPEVFDYIRT